MSTVQDVLDHIERNPVSSRHGNFDCSEIAEELLAEFPDGRIAEIRGPGGAGLTVRENGELEEMDYHQVFVLGDTAFDPRWSAMLESGTDLGYYRELIARVNGGRELEWTWL